MSRKTPNNFRTIVSRIKKIKIQGAQSIAEYSLKALQYISDKSRHKTVSLYLKELRKSKLVLFKSRPTEPAMRNSLNFVLHDLNGRDVARLKKELRFRIHKALNHFKISETIISKYGSRLIRNGSSVYTHCHSSTVINILKEAKKTKSFEVHNTETRPLYQGRKPALELASLKIPVYHYVDSAARIALKSSDIALFGADAITSTGKVINKIGSELIAEAAEKYQVPVYICTNSWKLDPQTCYGIDERIETRPRNEVWPHSPKSVHIINPAFEKIHPDLITGIISELGVHSPEVFFEEVKKTYPFIF